MSNINWSLITTWLKLYQSDIKEASGMLNIHFGLALIDTLDLIEEALSKKTRVLFQFRYNWIARFWVESRSVQLFKRILSITLNF